jgi:hypothetical protein
MTTLASARVLIWAGMPVVAAVLLAVVSGSSLGALMSYRRSGLRLPGNPPQTCEDVARPTPADTERLAKLGRGAAGKPRVALRNRGTGPTRPLRGTGEVLLATQLVDRLRNGRRTTGLERATFGLGKSSAIRRAIRAPGADDCGDTVVAAVSWHIPNRGSERELVNEEAHT